MSLFIKNIKKLIGVRQDAPLSPLKGKEMETLPCLDNAWLLTEGDRIKAFGEMNGTAPETIGAMEDGADGVIDAAGRMVFPSYCDSHTHLVYAGSREMEFMDKLRGLSYQEIARRGGGILNSVELLHNTEGMGDHLPRHRSRGDKERLRSDGGGRGEDAARGPQGGRGDAPHGTYYLFGRPRRACQV